MECTSKSFQSVQDSHTNTKFPVHSPWPQRKWNPGVIFGERGVTNTEQNHKKLKVNI